MTVAPASGVEGLVSIGVPVRNGERTLSYALDSVLRQTYRRIEVVLSENGSTDRTWEIAEQYAARDPRIRLVRQSTPITMMRNHAEVWRQCRGEFFMWLQDDDFLADDFVEKLQLALVDRPDAVLAFGKMVAFSDYQHLSDAVEISYPFATRGIAVWRRLWRNRHSGYHLKGLMRRSVLDGYRWYEHTISPDWPLLTYVMISGEVIEEPAAILYNGALRNPSEDERAASQSYSAVEARPVLSLSWRTAKAAHDAAARSGRRRSVLIDAALTYASLCWWSRRPRLAAAVRSTLSRS